MTDHGVAATSEATRRRVEAARGLTAGIAAAGYVGWGILAELGSGTGRKAGGVSLAYSYLWATLIYLVYPLVVIGALVAVKRRFGVQPPRNRRNEILGWAYVVVSVVAITYVEAARDLRYGWLWSLILPLPLWIRAGLSVWRLRG